MKSLQEPGRFNSRHSEFRDVRNFQEHIRNPELGTSMYFGRGDLVRLHASGKAETLIDPEVSWKIPYNFMRQYARHWVRQLSHAGVEHSPSEEEQPMRPVTEVSSRLMLEVTYPERLTPTVKRQSAGRGPGVSEAATDSRVVRHPYHPQNSAALVAKKGTWILVLFGVVGNCIPVGLTSVYLWGTLVMEAVRD